MASRSEILRHFSELLWMAGCRQQVLHNTVLFSAVSVINAMLSINRAQCKHYWNRPVAYPICRSVYVSGNCIVLCEEMYGV